VPELPEVETVRRGLAPAMEGARFKKVETRRKDLRWPFPKDFIKRLEGQKVEGVGRRAKYLTVDVSSGDVLLMHLGMSGSFRVEGGGPVGAQASSRRRGKHAAHDHVVLHTGDGARVVYNDPRRFGFMLLIESNELAAHPLLAGLGPEPTGRQLRPERLARRFARRSAPLKAALLDQSAIAGLGNIYASEALWRAGLSPRRAAGTLVRSDGSPTRRLERLVEAVRAVIAEAIRAGGSSLRDYVQTDGALGNFQHRFAVYDREHQPCLKPGCRGTIHRILQSGRSTFYCPECQR
jgi:formamidopyrimidine-DNA glycosylase